MALLRVTIRLLSRVRTVRIVEIIGAVCLLLVPLQWAVAVEPPIVFVSRLLDTVPDPVTRPRAIELARAGRLLVLEPGGSLRVLVDAFADGAPDGLPVDVADPDVSFDGERIAFAGYSMAEEAWRIFEIRADGTDLRQITQSDREIDFARYGDAAEPLRGYDDVDPCYLPDGRMCFVSTRYVGIASDGRLRPTNLYVVNADGSDLGRITSERFGADTPVVEPTTGRIIYSRFWRTGSFGQVGEEPPDEVLPGSPGYEAIVLEPSERILRGIPDEEFPGVNSWFLSSIRPDGRGLHMWSGFHLDRELTQAYRPSFLPGGEALALFLPVTPFIGYPRGYGLRRFSAGPGVPVALGGPQLFPRAHEEPPSVNYTYASAEGLPDGRLVVSAVPVVEESGNYALYTQENSETEPVLLYDDPVTLELDATALLARPVPPIIEDEATDRMSDDAPRDRDEAFEEGGSFKFLCENIFFNAPVDVPIPSAPPVGERLTIEFYLNSQRQSPAGRDPPILIGSLAISPSGRIEETLPAGTPLFEVLRRPDGAVALGRDGQIFHVAGSNFARAGETTRCVGCHTGHSQISVPEDPRWTNLAPSAVVKANSRRVFGRLNLRDFRELNLVDRRTGTPQTEWSGEEGAEMPGFDLRWNTTLSGRELVLYGTSGGDGPIGVREQVIGALKVTTSLRGEERESFDVVEEILPGGTRVDLDPALEFDRLSIRIPAENVTGLYEGRGGVALAEVEVISRALGESTLLFTRGDANCDLRVNISDPIAIVQVLFQGGGPFCCEAAADADDTEKTDLADAIYLLNFLFRGGPGLPEPSGCAPVSVETLLCDEGACF